MGTLIKNGRVIHATGSVDADVLIEGSTIKEVRAGIDAKGHTVVDAKGLYVMPGGIDVHTHLDMPFGGTVSADDYKTGTQAAAVGGTTALIDFALQSKGHTMREALKTWLAKSAGKACVDYGLHMAVTDLAPSGGSDDEGLDEMDAMVAEGISSFKLFMAYPNVLMIDDGLMFKVMQRAAKLNALCCIHAENGSAIDIVVAQMIAEGKTAPHFHALSRSTKAEAEATHRAIALADMAGATVYIVHLSNEDSLRELRHAQERGVRALAETCMQYLVLSIEDQMPGKSWEEAKYVFTPPLREKKNQEKLWEGLEDRSLSVVSTDHCPFRFADQKALGKDDFRKIPNGGPGVENRLHILYHYGVNSGKISLERFVELMSTAPARIFGMYPKKGIIAAGSDADILLWDPKAEYTISAATQTMNTDYSMFEGWKVKGNVMKVFSRGELIVDGGKYIGAVGRGEFLKRKTLAADVMEGNSPARTANRVA
jgi:dihydropyrimidinase